MHLDIYLQELEQRFIAGNATEHTYRSTLETLLQTAAPDITITNEPKQIACGAPDFVLTRNQIPLGYIETKDLANNLDNPQHAEQLNRYTESLSNLIFTNYLEFRLLRDGELIAHTQIATIINNKIKLLTQNFNQLTELLNTFIGYQGQSIATADDLAKRMASKARLLSNIIEQALTQDLAALSDNQINQNQIALVAQLKAFQQYLTSELSPAEFADAYAQTVTYGMFAARLRHRHIRFYPATSRRTDTGHQPVSTTILSAYRRL